MADLTVLMRSTWTVIQTPHDLVQYTDDLQHALQSLLEYWRETFIGYSKTYTMKKSGNQPLLKRHAILIGRMGCHWHRRALEMLSSTYPCGRPARPVHRQMLVTEVTGRQSHLEEHPQCPVFNAGCCAS